MTGCCPNRAQLMTTYCIRGHFWILVHADHFRGTSCNIINPKEIDSHGCSRLKSLPCKSCLHLISSIFICVPQITYFTCQNIHTKKAFIYQRPFLLIWCVFTILGASQLFHCDLKVFCKRDQFQIDFCPSCGLFCGLIRGK